MLTATQQAVLPAPLYYRHLRLQLAQSLRQSASFDTVVTLNTGARQDLEWWTKHLSSWNDWSIKAPPPDTIMETDASMIGWGATCMGTRTGGLWSPQEQQRHINSLELQAGEFAVSGCLPSCLHMRQQSGCPSADRRVFACPFINDLSKADEASLSVVAVLSPRGITLSAEYLPGVQNIVADEESRSPQRSGNSSPMCSENSGPLFSGLVSHSIQPPVAQVCELEARSICHGNGCLQPRPPRLHDLL